MAEWLSDSAIKPNMKLLRLRNFEGSYLDPSGSTSKIATSCSPILYMTTSRLWAVVDLSGAFIVFHSNLIVVVEPCIHIIRRGLLYPSGQAAIIFEYVTSVG